MQPRKQKDAATIIFLQVMAISFIVFVSLSLFSCKATNKIIKSNTDERGLTSIVMVTCSNDTFAFDYLDKRELDSIINNQH